MSRESQNILQGLRAQLKYHESLGFSGYFKSDEVLSFLKKQPTVKTQAEQSTGLKPVAASAGRVSQVSEQESTVSITELADEIEKCHACDLHLQRVYPVPGQGPEQVRLMIVGDWLAADSQGELPVGKLFGTHQDIMLSKMLEAISLPIQQVFVTNVIKCAIRHKVQPQATHVDSCISFLRRQIETLKPEVICTMGMVAARAVLERAQPLSRLRSQFHDYSPRKGLSIPVLATYHPTYLLQNPEMKGATWADLQLLAKKMGLVIRA